MDVWCECPKSKTSKHIINKKSPNKGYQDTWEKWTFAHNLQIIKQNTPILKRIKQLIKKKKKESKKGISRYMGKWTFAHNLQII